MRDPRSAPSRPAPTSSAPPAAYPPPVPPPAWHPAPPQARHELRIYCPKCRGELITYERAGVHLEQCGDCRGIWLDRGELDRLIDAEGAPARAPGRGDDRGAGDDRDRRERSRGRDDDGYGRRERWGDDDDDDDRRDRWDRRADDDERRGRPSRRRGMFGDLFEGLLE
jgi:hypothetical protein